MTELKPCPFCGGYSTKVMQTFAGRKRDEFEVFCEKCLSSGPVEDNRYSAIAAWNRRAT